MHLLAGAAKDIHPNFTFKFSEVLHLQQYFVHNVLSKADVTMVVESAFLLG